MGREIDVGWVPAGKGTVVASLRSQLAAANDRIRELEGVLKEAEEIVAELMNDEDFQPCFDQRNFMVGPALLGGLSRIKDALVRAALQPAPAADQGGEDG